MRYNVGMNKIGERLKSVREEQGFTQRSLAQKIGISQSTYSDLERGDNLGRSVGIFARVAQALGVSADYLLGIEEETRAKSRKSAGPASLTPLEDELLGLVREMRPRRRKTVLQMVRDLHEEETALRRHLQLLEEIEQLDTTGLFERSQERLFVLASELGSMRAAVSALKLEIEAEMRPQADSD